MTALASGAHVGKYVLSRELGRGAMATVFEARHEELGKRVALKTMHPHLAVDPTAASRFLREGKAAAQIRSAHVVDIFDVGTQNDVPYLVMELIEGVDLGEYIRERGKLTPREIAELMLPICSAVAAAHAVGVIHRDLKPSNIMLAKDASDALTPTVLDFGISKIERDPGDDLTASEVLLGTVHYMSPERTRGARTGGALSDVYSLGVILYECATGAKPFAGATPYSLMHAIVSTKVAPPSSLAPSVPRAFDDVVLRAMHRDPSKRFPSARALGAALSQWASDESRQKWQAEFGGEKSQTKRSGRTALWVVGAIVICGLAVAVRKPEPHESSAPAPSTSLKPVMTPATAQPSVAPVESTPAGILAMPAPSIAPRATASSHARPRVSADADIEQGTNGAPIVE